MTVFRGIYIDIYEYNIYYTFCSPKRYAAKVKAVFNKTTRLDTEFQSSFEVIRKNKTPIGIIWVKDKKDICSIAHECFHATHEILQ